MIREKHLFILSGQSNMQRLKLAASFTPAITQALGENALIVKEAWGGQPIRRWCTAWQSVDGVAWPEKEHRRNTGDLYQRLLNSVQAAVNGGALASCTLIWMQGEDDAEEHLAGAYEANLRSFLHKIQADLQLTSLSLVLGKLNGYGLYIGGSKSRYWAEVQRAQMCVAANRPDTVLVNTDDLDVSADKLHLSERGYRQLGQRFATAALALVKP